MSITEERAAALQEILADWKQADPEQVWDAFDFEDFNEMVGDLADLLAEVHQLRAELAKTREITSEKVEYGGHAIWLESETSLCGIHECRYYGDDGDADYSCQCARCEKTAQLYAHAALDGTLRRDQS